MLEFALVLSCSLVAPSALTLRQPQPYAVRLRLVAAEQLPQVPPPPPPPAQPPWVKSVNNALETSATSTLLAFVLLDLGSASCILGALVALSVPVGADFALALALSKALRGPRLALDTALAALLARRFPSLRAVKVSLLLDQLADTWAEVRRSFDEGRLEATGDSKSATVEGFPPGFTPRPGRGAAASLAARKLTTEYGLAYLAAKNIIGPACTLLMLGALRSGGRARAATASLMRTFGVTAGSAGAFAGQVALAATLSHVLFPGIVLVAAKLGPWMATRAADPGTTSER